MEEGAFAHEIRTKGHIWLRCCFLLFWLEFFLVRTAPGNRSVRVPGLITAHWARLLLLQVRRGAAWPRVRLATSSALSTLLLLQTSMVLLTSFTLNLVNGDQILVQSLRALKLIN